MVEYDPFMPEMREDPFPVYARLREESPVHFLEKYDSWALSRFQDVWDASQDPELYAAPGPGLLMGAGEDFDRLDPEAANSIFGLNPPVHTQLRKRIFRLFSPSGVKKLEAEVREAVKACLAETLPTGKMDVISDLGIRLSSRVACMLIGLPLSDAASLVS